MKKRILIFGVCASMLWACGGKQEASTSSSEETTSQQETPASTTQEENAIDPQQEIIASGRALVAGSDCMTCHSKDNKIIGPAHMAVAEKYEFTDANVKMLAHKIISGGSGVWGETPMTPHPTISEGDAEKMATYVLSLDGEKLH